MKLFSQLIIHLFIFYVSENNAEETTGVLHDNPKSDEIFSNTQKFGNKTVYHLRLRGGKHAGHGSFPYQLHLSFGDGHFCGGTIIDNYFGITAAHCVTGKFFNHSIKALAGVTDLNNPQPEKQTVDVIKVYVPRQYLRIPNISPQVADIAVIKFKKPLEFNEFVTKAYPPKQEIYENMWAVASGFGRNWQDIAYDESTSKLKVVNYGKDNKLRFVHVKILSEKNCYVSNPETIICGRIQGDPSKNGVCAGDSGSPLVIYEQNKFRLIGVVIAGNSACNEVGGPGYYTRVSKYLDFIKTAGTDNVDKTVLVWEPPIEDDHDDLFGDLDISENNTSYDIFAPENDFIH